MAGTERYLKTSALNATNALQIIVTEMLAAGWTDASGGVGGLINFPALGGGSAGNNGGHVHLNSPNAKTMVNLACGARHSGQTDGSGTNDASQHPGTPYQIGSHRYDCEKDNTAVASAGAWSWPKTYPVGWIALNCSNYNAYSGSNFWSEMPGGPIYNSLVRGYYEMMLFEGTGGDNLGPAISDLWVICHADPAMVVVSAKKTTSSGKIIFQHMWFGEEIHKGATFTGGAFFGATHVGWTSNPYNWIIQHAPNYQPAGFALPAGSGDTTQYPFAQAFWHTNVKCDDTGVPGGSDHPCLGGRTNGWGCGGGNIGTGGGVTTNSAPSEGSFYLPINTWKWQSVSPSAAYSWDAARGYSKIEEVLMFRRALDGQGGRFMGSIPNVGYTSMEPYLGGNEISVDGDTYIVFPFHNRSVPWTIDGLGNMNTATYADRTANHSGIGFAVRKPNV